RRRRHRLRHVRRFRFARLAQARLRRTLPVRELSKGGARAVMVGECWGRRGEPWGVTTRWERRYRPRGGSDVHIVRRPGSGPRSGARRHLIVAVTETPRLRIVATRQYAPLC